MLDAMTRDDLRSQLADPQLVALLDEESRIADAKNQFPARAIAELAARGLLAVGVPREFGGPKWDATLCIQIASSLGRICPSLAIIWAMHTQQLVAIGRSGWASLGSFCDRQVTRPRLIASVTSEKDSHADIMNPGAAAELSNGSLSLDRFAPFVSYGGHAGVLLVTARIRQDGADEPALIAIDREQADVEALGSWSGMGMRGTQSLPLKVRCVASAAQIVASPIAELVNSIFIPYGHLLYGAAWFGCASAALDAATRFLREAAIAHRRTLESEQLRHRLADAALRVQMMRCLLLVASQRAQQIDLGVVREMRDTMLFNDVKTGCSELAFSVVNLLIEVIGAGRGYCGSKGFSFEKAFRDLRAASLMFHNDRIRERNGQLQFLRNLQVGDAELVL